MTTPPEYAANKVIEMMQIELEKSREQLAEEYIHVSSRINELAFDKYGIAKVTPELLADYKARRVMNSIIAAGIKDPIVLDLFTGIGGDTVALAKAGFNVLTIELDEVRHQHAKQNANLYHVDKNIIFALGDGFLYLRAGSIDGLPLNFDAVVSAPTLTDKIEPGSTAHVKRLEEMTVDCIELLSLVRKYTPNVCLMLPKNMDREQVRSMGICEIEETYMNGDLFYLSVYFGCLMNKEGTTKAMAEHPLYKYSKRKAESDFPIVNYSKGDSVSDFKGDFHV